MKPPCPKGGEGKQSLGDPPVHGQLLGKQSPVVAPGVGSIQAVADLLPDGEGDFEGVGSHLGGGGTAVVGAEGVGGAAVLEEEGQGEMSLQCPHVLSLSLSPCSPLPV